MVRPLARGLGAADVAGAADFPSVPLLAALRGFTDAAFFMVVALPGSSFASPWRCCLGYPAMEEKQEADDEESSESGGDPPSEPDAEATKGGGDNEEGSCFTDGHG